jgi:hypothetical protein
MDMIKIIETLAFKLANEINMSPLASRGLLKLCLKEELGPFKPFEKVSYQELEKTLYNSLNNRLERLKITRRNEIVKNLIENLKESKSEIFRNEISDFPMNLL